MICQEHRCFISPEVEELIATEPHHVDGIRALAAMLPEADAELEEALLEAGRRGRADHLSYGLQAAAFANRTLSLAVLRPALTLGTCGWTAAWHAWRMEGDVLAELRWAFESLEIPRDHQAMLLFVAAAIGRRPAEAVTPMPEWVLTRATALLKGEAARVTAGKPAAAGMNLMKGLILLFEDKAEWENKPKDLRTLKGGLGWLEAPYEQLLFERRTKDWVSAVPQRRAVARIGRNEKCPCGSGRKYKQCCEGADRERLRDSSPVEGMTRQEFQADPTALLTEKTLGELQPHQLLLVKAGQLAGKLQGKFFAMLVRHRQFDAVISCLQGCAVADGDGKTLPPNLHAVWVDMLGAAVEKWEPQFARSLLQVFPDVAEKLGETSAARARLVAAGDEVAKFIEVLEAELRLALAGPGSQRVQDVVTAVLHSPWRGLGIFLTRSLLPIAPEEIGSGLYEKILETRARLDLSADDAFSDFMDERTLRAGRDSDSAAMQDAQDALAAKAEELRRARGERAHLERELKLARRQERRAEQEAQSAAVRPELAAQGHVRDLKTKIERLNALVAEGAKERAALRRAAEEKARENAALLAHAPAQPATDDAADADETVEVTDGQPVRLLSFPKHFETTLGGFPRHVGRATMNRLGRLASGERDAFHAVKQLKAYPGVLRARVADNHRLLFTLSHDRICVVDLIRRRDLDRRIERLLASGLPEAT